jgi:hypothetical protein
VTLELIVQNLVLTVLKRCSKNITNASNLTPQAGRLFAKDKRRKNASYLLRNLCGRYVFFGLELNLTKTSVQNKKGWKVERTGNITFDILCDSWDAFLNFLHHDNGLKENQNYVFRGHASENWTLEPTLKRVLEDRDAFEVKKQTIDAFKKFSLGRRGHNPAPLSEEEWWALGQHFGLHTPLLDWTESPYIASFFAFNSDNDETENIVVWALKKDINENPCISKLKEDQHLKFMYPYLDENARLINQRGLFILSPDMVCIEEWVKDVVKDTTVGLARILIPKSEKALVLDSLDKMNINEFSLFPDLSGAAQHANYIQNRKHNKAFKRN